MRRTFLLIALLATAVGCAPQQKQLTDYVNPLLGTATLWDSVDLGFRPTKRTWGAEVFPGASLPNALVQASPVTKFHSGSGYQYEDTVIYGFTHSNKGHWNLCHIPLLPVTGTPTPEDYCSPYSHDRETAAPGYYEVFLDRYGVDAELTTTLRCALHRYTFLGGPSLRCWPTCSARTSGSAAGRSARWVTTPLPDGSGPARRCTSMPWPAAP